MCDYIAQKKGKTMELFCREIVQKAKEDFEENGYEFNIRKGLGAYYYNKEACPDEETRAMEIVADAYAEFKCSKTARPIACYIGNLLEGELL